VQYFNLTVFDHPSIHPHLLLLNVEPRPKRFKIIINPNAGRGKAVGLFDSMVKPILEASGCQVVDQIPDGARDTISHVHITTRPKEATEVVTHILVDHYDSVLCVGGDGTVHEVINGLANRPDGSRILDRVTIGTIPAGIDSLYVPF
jgi:sphingosine kinase